MKMSYIIICVLCIAFSVIICGMVSGGNYFDVDSIKSYQDIPGVTAEEIAAIEAVKASRDHLMYANLLTTETFILPDGTLAGFSSDFCALLSDLFGIPFIPGVHDWDDLKRGLDRGLCDFSGEFTPTPERRQIYYMSHPIKERSLRIFTNKDSRRVIVESDFNNLKVGFFEGSITAASIRSTYPDVSFTQVDIKTFAEAAEKIKSGELDAFIEDGVADMGFEKYDYIKSQPIFPLVYTPVSLTTANPELEPFISVVSKYLEAGGIDKLFHMYKQGETAYVMYKLSRSFTDEEKAYIDGLAARGEKVSVALENSNYPVCFYNTTEREFQGIAADVLKEITNLTGIQFDPISDTNVTWADIMQKLKTGEISMVSELIYSESRKNDFIWCGSPYASSNYALLSRWDFPDLQIYQVVRTRVGVVAESGYEDMYYSWFSDSNKSVRYSSVNEAFDALERGEIDLLMASVHTLLSQTNYREKSGFKINISFVETVDSQFGFSKGEDVLCSIIEKTQAYINTDSIASHWTQRVFDYAKKFNQERMIYLSVFLAVLLLVLFMVLNLYTKNRQISKKFEEKANTLSAIYTAIPDMLYSKDMDGRYTSCNSSFAAFAGYSESEIIGKSALEIFKDDRNEMALSFLITDKRVQYRNAPEVVQVWHIFPDGSRRLFETIKAPLRKNGHIVGLVGISRDIMEHKNAVEEAHAASMAKSVFLARMSHEIRTPINVIMGMSELILRRDMPQPVFENALSIKHASTNLLSIINDILDFTKVEAGKLEIIPSEYMLSSLISDILSILQVRISEKPLILTVSVDSRLPRMLIGDEARLRQVLLNILDNAVKYTKEGCISLTLTGRRQEDEMILSFEVTDSGIGIKNEDLDRLFEDFVQVDSHKNKGVTGTGLGLAISRSLCREMGGDISVSSEYGAGSTFVITIPQKLCTDEALASVTNPDKKSALIYDPRPQYADSVFYGIDNLGVSCTMVSALPQFYDALKQKTYPFVFIASSLLEDVKNSIARISPDSRIVLISEYGEFSPSPNIRAITMPTYSLPIANILNDVESNLLYSELQKIDMLFTAPAARILVVDDVDTNLRVTEGLLLPYKMQVDVCKSGAEAIKLVQHNRYDIVFMDHMMPEMDGIEATAKIRGLENGNGYYKNLPIIALTANAISGMREMFISSGLDDFLAKPIELPKLNNLLEKWIPQEKREKSIEEMPQPSQPQSPVSFKIAGIDIDYGISMTGGSIEHYLNTLGVFYNDAFEKVSQLRACVANKDIKLYTTYVHAIKSASASIGALNISDFAKTLEIAGKSGATAFIEENTELFLAELETLIEGIKLSLPVDLGCRDDKFPWDELCKLKDALELMDAGKISSIMKDLEGKMWNSKTSELINDIAKLILLFEYDDAIAVIDSWL